MEIVQTRSFLGVRMMSVRLVVVLLTRCHIGKLSGTGVPLRSGDSSGRSVPVPTLTGCPSAGDRSLGRGGAVLAGLIVWRGGRVILVELDGRGIMSGVDLREWSAGAGA